MIALYDEQEVLDRYVASREKESEIKATVNTLKEVGRSITEVADYIIAKFGLSSAAAETKVKEYWA
jgi:hypothetical protein